MPYITTDKREKFDDLIFELADRIEAPGELAYVLTKIVRTHEIEQPLEFSVLNSMIGVLENVKLEYHRQIVAQYEDRKQMENGDVFYEPDEDSAAVTQLFMDHDSDAAA